MENQRKKLESRKFFEKKLGNREPSREKKFAVENFCKKGVVVAAEEEELLEDLRRERGVLLPRPRRRRRGRAVAADAAHLPLLVLVVVPADPARVLALALPHLPRPPPRPPPPPPIESEKNRKRGAADRIGSLSRSEERRWKKGAEFSFIFR